MMIQRDGGAGMEAESKSGSRGGWGPGLVVKRMMRAARSMMGMT
jgi:hypothetical protein